MEITTPSQPWGDKSSFKMIDVGSKVATQRRAIGEGQIILAEDSFLALQNKTNPKGDVLSLAEVAGIMAAKRTADTIPLCHPLPLDFVKLSFELDSSTRSVKVFCEVGTTAKTGVEMEALSGVNGALLTIYDLSKAVNPLITISSMRLILKEGGKSGRWTPDQPSSVKAFVSQLSEVKACVLTVSDRLSKGIGQDISGPLLKSKLIRQGASLLKHFVIADDLETIQSSVLDCVRNLKADLVITTGGTGLGPRDVTPEALEKIAHRKINGFGELLRASGAKFIKTAWLSRSIAIVIDQSIVVALPGSKNAVSEGFDEILPLLNHALHTLRGGNHD